MRIWRKMAKQTCPQPSSRKTRPNVEAPMNVLTLSRYNRKDSIVETELDEQRPEAGKKCSQATSGGEMVIPGLPRQCRITCY